jgi:hypothetical protein
VTAPVGALVRAGERTDDGRGTSSVNEIHANGFPTTPLATSWRAAAFEDPLDRVAGKPGKRRRRSSLPEARR